MKLAIVLVLAVGGLLYAFSDDEDAMKACQRHHSHSECFHALNR